MNIWKNYALRLSAVGAYRSFLVLPPVQALAKLIRALAEETADDEALLDHYAETFYALQKAGYDSLGGYLWEHFRYDETPYGDAAARAQPTRPWSMRRGGMWKHLQRCLRLRRRSGALRSPGGPEKRPLRCCLFGALTTRCLLKF